MSNTTEENIKLALKKHIEENNVSLKYIAEKAGQTVAAVKTVLSPSSRGPALAYRTIAEILGLDYKELREANLSDEIKNIATKKPHSNSDLVDALARAGRLAKEYSDGFRTIDVSCLDLGLCVSFTQITGPQTFKQQEIIEWDRLKHGNAMILIDLTFDRVMRAIRLEVANIKVSGNGPY